MTAVQDPWTTIRVRTSTRDLLFNERRLPDLNFDDIINKLLRRESDVYCDVLSVDGELAKSTDHEVIIQLGKGKYARFYKYRRDDFEVLKAAPKMVTVA